MDDEVKKNLRTELERTRRKQLILVAVTSAAVALVAAVAVTVSTPTRAVRHLKVIGNLSQSELDKTHATPTYTTLRLGNFEPPQNLEESEETAEELLPGEGGRPHRLNVTRLEEEIQSVKEYGMNIAVSDEISLNRSIPDTRMEECKYWNYPENLPAASVIIVFYNEGLSAVLRTIHSVVNRTPKQFLEEVVLVDDYSDKIDLGFPLEDAIKEFGGKVKLFRNSKREGLIRSRNVGARASVGEVIVFLDAHCEVNINWLPPLLAPIYRDSTVLTVPVIDGIEMDSFEYIPVYKQKDAGGLWGYVEPEMARGIFDWGLLYKEMKFSDAEIAERIHRSETYKSPTHSGGLLAINREFFLDLGAYDPQLLGWGAENFELSFKIWQCGGSIEWVPCSRIGHVYRKKSPYTFGRLNYERQGPIITGNFRRVVEVWMDEKYKEFYYTKEPSSRNLDAGDITEQLHLKERLGCKNFTWYMENVATGLLEQYPEPPPNRHWGVLRHDDTSLCVHSPAVQPKTMLNVSTCHNQGLGQLLRLNTRGQLGYGELCVEAGPNLVAIIECEPKVTAGPWTYDQKDRRMVHRVLDMCMGVRNSSLTMVKCDDQNVAAGDTWTWNTVDPDEWKRPNVIMRAFIHLARTLILNLRR